MTQISSTKLRDTGKTEKCELLQKEMHGASGDIVAIAEMNSFKSGILAWCEDGVIG